MIILETRDILDPGMIWTLVEKVAWEIGIYSSEPEITCAASLSHHRLLGSVEEIVLHDDLTSVPAEHLVSLTSSVTGSVEIRNVSGYDLVTILNCVKSKKLWISSQSLLGSEETRALVRAMESRVEDVRLDEEVTLDISSLIEYSGQGKCRELGCYDEVGAKYREHLLAWATNRNWEVKEPRESWFNVKTREFIQTQSTSLIFIQPVSCKDQKTSPNTLQ